MRKSPIAMAITMALLKDMPVRLGPISPYVTDLNRRLYYGMFDKPVKARAVGKTLSYPEHYYNDRFNQKPVGKD